MNALLDDGQIAALIKESITLLCKNALRFDLELAVEGLLGITLDKKNVLLVNIKECIQTASFERNYFIESPLPFNGKEYSKETGLVRKRKQNKKTNRKVKKQKGKAVPGDFNTKNIDKETDRCTDEEGSLEFIDFKEEIEERLGEHDKDYDHTTDDPDESTTGSVDDDDNEEEDDDAEVLPQNTSDTEVDIEVAHSIRQELVRSTQEHKEDEGVPLNFKSISSTPQCYRQPSTSQPYSENSGTGRPVKKICIEKDTIDGSPSSSAQKYKCDICGCTMSNNYGLRRHKSRKHGLGGDLHVCTICGKVCYDKCYLSDHMDSHSGIKRHVCQQCGQGFTYRSSLVSHNASRVCTRRIEDSKPACVIGVSFVTKETNNIGNKCMDTAGLKSERISPVLISPENISNEDHERNLDKIIKIGKKCPECDYSSPKKSNLKRHYEGKHMGLRLECPKCNKSFRDKYVLNQHLKSIHTSTGGWICECHGKKFGTLKGYRLHVQKERGELKYKYTCPQCGKGQSTEEKHTQHMNTHAGIKPFTCDLCPKSFVSALYLKLHRKRCISGRTSWGPNRHKRDGPVKCALCHKEFTKEINMKRHVESKHGHAQFSCPKCERSFQWRASRDRHIRQNMCKCTVNQVVKQDEQDS